MRRMIHGILLFLSVFLLISCGTAANEVPEDVVTVTFFDIGKADATLISYGDYHMLIDTGEDENAETLLSELQSLHIEKFNCLILTHFDKDHIGGAPQILSNIPADRILLPDYTGTGDAYTALLACFDSLSLQPERLTEDTSFQVEELYFAISVPKNVNYDESQDNNSSLVVYAEFGTQRMFFAGDAERLRQQELLSSGLPTVSLLKVPHHGEWNKNLDSFFEALNPQYAVITCSLKNPADEKTISALSELGTDIYYTASGNVNAIVTKKQTVITQNT